MLYCCFSTFYFDFFATGVVLCGGLCTYNRARSIIDCSFEKTRGTSFLILHISLEVMQ